MFIVLVVWTNEDIDRVIHHGRDEKLSGKQIEQIVAALGRTQNLF